MTKTETSKLLAVLAAAYPRFEPDELTLTVWHEMLGDLDYPIASLAVKACMLQNTFPPSISEVRKAAVKLMHPEKLSASEAWEKVNAALDKHGIYGQVEAMESLPPLVARVVRAIGFGKMCLSENLGVERGQYMRMYDEMSGKQDTEMLIPGRMRVQIAAVAGRLQIEGRKD